MLPSMCGVVLFAACPLVSCGMGQQVPPQAAAIFGVICRS